MKIFADTNFLVSAFTGRGLSTDVFQVILAEHELMTGEFVLQELRRVLADEFYMPDNLVSEAEQLLRRHHVEPIPENPSSIKVIDSDDRWVLASAMQSNADVLITGDKDLLDVAEQVDKLNILTPRGFWELLKD